MAPWAAGVIGAAIALALPTVAGVSAGAPPLNDRLSQRVMRLTRATMWTAVAAIPIPFGTFHPQGMVKIGDDFYLSSVEVRQAPKALISSSGEKRRDPGAGVGHLFKFRMDGTLIADLRLGEGAIYHPGGIDFDGRWIWVPVSEYRPFSRAIVYRIDPVTMRATEAFRFGDHLGGVVYDRKPRQLHAMNWGSRRFYTWPVSVRGSISTAEQPLQASNPNQYIDYQDCHYAPTRKMVCSGLAEYTSPTGEPFQLGGIDLVDLKSAAPIWQAPIELRSPSGRLMTQNPFFLEDTASGLRAYFLPDDDHSTLFVFDAIL